MEKNGMPELLLFFQVQSPFAGYRNLTMEPFEAAIQTSTSGPLDTVGAIRIESAYTGWNLVGYPATNDSTYTVGNLKADTGATYVEGFSAAATYKTAVLADAYILKKGEAYWVYVPADTTWTVNW